MPVYEYSALDRTGKNVRGIIDAESSFAARQKLRGKGIFPVNVNETSARSRGEVQRKNSISVFFKRIKSSEISTITRQLSILLGAGVTLVGSLDALILQVKNPALKRVLAHVKESVNEGNSLAQSLARYPKAFSQIYINMVRAGEASGSLDLVLERLAEFSERQQALRGRIRAAMAYPVFMILIGTAILFFLITFIVPNITRIFVEMEQTLPLPTILLISFSNFVKTFWWALAGAVLFTIVLINRLVKTSRGRHMWDHLKIRSPIVGQMNIKMAMARFSRTLASLLRSGVPLITSMKIVRNIVNNVLIAEVIDDAMEEIEAGNNLSGPLSRSRWFPNIAVQMISVGEQSGELENMLDKVADVYEGEVESQTMAITSMLEPVMILAMGLAVGFIVISILLPIFEMNQMIR